MEGLKKEQFLEILNKHHIGTASPAEEEFLRTYFNIFDLDEGYVDTLNEREAYELSNRLKNKIELDIANFEGVAPVPVKRWDLGWVAAAVLLVISSVGFYRYKISTNPTNTLQQYTVSNDVPAGGNKAILTLSNGSRISLTDASNGELANQAGLKIIKTRDGELVYEVTPVSGDAAVRYNTIETPKGGQYQVNLPDGTRVWLNAASSVRFPATFSNVSQRKVELNGEAYFEVVHARNKPFKVIAAGQEVEVLGTHFNINAYADEPAVVTSLLEGSVKITHNLETEMLLPGEQAEVKDYIRVKKIEGDVIAWKNGITSFKDAEITTIMRQIARWYDVEIKYKGEIPKKKFNGDVLRSANLSEFIKVMEFSGLHFKVEGRTITVMP